MTTQQTAIQRPLDDIELGYLHALATSGRLEAWVDVLLGLYRAVLGARTFDELEKVDPSSVQIPYAQWADICNELLHGFTSDRVCLAMELANIGPSTYGKDGGA
jgi:hypothetical protein